jgi:hypothetical protein
MRTIKRLAIAGAALALAASLAACSGGKSPNNPPSIIPQHEPTASRPQQDFPDEGVTTTTTPKIAVAHYQIGQTANLAIVNASVGQVGAVAPRFAVSPSSPTARKLQVSRVATSLGDSDNGRPVKGHYLGFYLKYKMVTDPDQSLTWTDYVVVNGHHYDESTDYVAAFDPTLSGNDTQHAGETIEGWVTFDVPARHGTYVIVDQLSNEQVAIWSF